MLENESTATRPDGSVVRVIAETPELLAEGIAHIETIEKPQSTDIDVPQGETTGQALDMGDDRIQAAVAESVAVTPGLTVPSTADVVAAEQAVTPEDVPVTQDVVPADPAVETTPPVTE